MDRTTALAFTNRMQDVWDPDRQWSPATTSAWTAALEPLPEGIVRDYLSKRRNAGQPAPTISELVGHVNGNRVYEVPPKGCERCDGHGFLEHIDDEQRTWVKACTCSAGNTRRDVIANIAERNDRELRHCGVRQ